MIVKAVSLVLSSLSLTYSFTPTKPFAFSSSASSLVAHMSKLQAGDVVTATYSLTPNDDFVPAPLFDDGTVTFALHKGNYLPGLHTALSTMKPGDTKTDLTLDAGWGERRDELVVELPIESSGMTADKLKLDMELYMSNGQSCRITKIDADAGKFTIDANPKLAGATYSATLTLDEVNDGPSEKKFEYTPMGLVAEDESPYKVMTIALGCFWG
jgi:FKBP-type peptidyl-prolyl cis-trans isomerase 2